MGLVIWRARQQLTLFVLRVENGRVVAVKGRIPRRLLGDIADVVRQACCRETRVICRIEEQAARIRVYGDTNPDLEQMLRNLVGEYPIPRLKQAPRAAAPESRARGGR